MASDPVLGRAKSVARTRLLRAREAEAEAIALRARLAEAERLLRAFDENAWTHCLWCMDRDGHAPDCALARWLEGGR